MFSLPLPLDFYLITDLHHYSHSLGISGEAFEKKDMREQLCLAETGAIIDAYIDKILEDKNTNIVLVAGDVSNNGAMESHLELIPKLRRFKEAGKRVFLITATHDYYVEGNSVGDPVKLVGDREYPATRTRREQLIELYREFGLDEAVAFHSQSHSYCVKLQEGYRLLCLNDDGDRSFCGYSEDQMQWILGQIEDAKAAGDYIFVMTHHPTLPPMPLYPVISNGDMLGDWDRTTTVLADAGIELAFTGHAHMHNIGLKITEKGNRYYDVNTSALVGYPSNMRKVRIDDEKIEIHSLSVDSFDWDMKGLTVDEYTKRHFSSMINQILDAAADDFEYFADLAESFSMRHEQSYKLRKPITFVGKGLRRWTLGSAGRLLGVSKKIDPSVKDLVARDIILELIQNAFRGNEPYYPDTPLYIAVSAIIDRISKPLSHFKKTRDAVSLLQALKLSFYNQGPDDYEFVIERKKG